MVVVGSLSLAPPVGPASESEVAETVWTLVLVEVSTMVIVMTVVEEPVPRVYVSVWLPPVGIGELPVVPDEPVVSGIVGRALLPVPRGAEELP